jgi:septum formation topological specificity factor MinE
MKQLERLLLFQGNRCFFCDEAIPEGEASIEHLVASANGGGNDDENCVACCRSLNAAFGSRPYKEKLRAILSHRGRFKCPRDSAVKAAPPQGTSPEAPQDRLTLVLTDLQKRGAARPRKVATLRNTIAAVFRKQISEDEVTALLSKLVASGRVIVNDQQVSYKLHPAKGA